MKQGHTGTVDGLEPCALGDHCKRGGRHSFINSRFWNYADFGPKKKKEEDR